MRYLILFLSGIIFFVIGALKHNIEFMNLGLYSLILAIHVKLEKL